MPNFNKQNSLYIHPKHVNIFKTSKNRGLGEAIKKSLNFLNFFKKKY